MASASDEIDEALRASFLADWTARYPETPPIQYMFKYRMPDRWARIHSLPGSKRYATTDSQRAEILRRQNTVILDLVGAATPLRVVCQWLRHDHPLFAVRTITQIGSVFEDGIDEGEDGECELCTYVTTWDPPDDMLLSAIADDDARGFLIAPDCLIAPYDGGMDVILKDAQSAEEFKIKYSSWLSKRADGF